MLPQQNDRPAIMWVLSGTLIWTLIFAAGKFADGASGAVQITFLRYLGAFVTLALLLPWKGGLQSHRSKQPLVHLVRAVADCSAAVAIT